MRKLFIAISFLVCNLYCFSQDDYTAIIREGIGLHDQGKYEEAIRKYDEVLAKDANHYVANYEKSYSLMMLKQYDECIRICELLMRIDPNNRNTKGVYVNWASAYDVSGKPEKAIEIYGQGIAAFPDFYLLHFNRAITYAGLNQGDKAILGFQQALIYNPLHAGSHRYLGLMMKENRIASLISFYTFLLIEPQGERAKADYIDMSGAIMKGISDNKDGKGTTITLDAGLLDNKNQKKENDFSSVEMMFTLSGALDKEEAFKSQNAAERLDRKMQLLINDLKDKKSDGKGFYWNFYVPFLVELKAKDHLLTACYIASLNSGDAKVGDWLANNKEKLNAFFQWLKEYTWPAVK
jgi:tetratricopeptide (TPR) repeat protein